MPPISSTNALIAYAIFMWDNFMWIILRLEDNRWLIYADCTHLGFIIHCYCTCSRLAVTALHSLFLLYFLYRLGAQRLNHCDKITKMDKRSRVNNIIYANSSFQKYQRETNKYILVKLGRFFFKFHYLTKRKKQLNSVYKVK